MKSNVAFTIRPPRPRIAVSDASPFTGYKPQDLWQVYNFPKKYDGTGIVIALLEFGSGYSPVDNAAFCKATGLPPVDITDVPVDSGQNDGGGQAQDAEATLDVQVAHGAAPGAKILNFTAPNPVSYPDFSQELVDGLRAVLAYPIRPDVLSISYGDAEANFPEALMQQADELIAQIVARGTLVFIAPGDQGAYGTHQMGLARIRRADFPATCTHAIAVGGTTLHWTPGQAPQESVWGFSIFGATGGGVSQVYPRPPYQDPYAPLCPMRGEPDLAAVGDPTTGHFVVFEGKEQVIGGTSASTPLIAGLFARILQARKENGLGPLLNPHEALYALKGKGFRDITWGNNSFDMTVGYEAGRGFDLASGWGAPDGEALLAELGGEVVPLETKVPVTIAGKEQSFEAVILNGEALVPAVLFAKALGATASRDEKGVYVTPKA